ARAIADTNRAGRPAILDRALEREGRAVGAEHGARESRALFLEGKRDRPIRTLVHICTGERLRDCRARPEEESKEENAGHDSLRAGAPFGADHTALASPYAQPGDRGSAGARRPAGHAFNDTRKTNGHPRRKHSGGGRRGSAYFPAAR